MKPLTGRERISNILSRKPVDRIGVFEHFWDDTIAAWQAAGKFPQGVSPADHFSFDMDVCTCFNSVADLSFGGEVVDEDENTVLRRDGNGALLRHHKHQPGAPEHVGYSVVDRQSWAEQIKQRLDASMGRIDVAAYCQTREDCREAERFFCWAGNGAFELMVPVCGHESLLMGMALDPDWITEMAETYAEWTIQMLELLFAKGGMPDGVWLYEDLGFAGRPFMSANSYRRHLQPAHRRVIDFCHAKGLPAIMHSCGFIEPLLPELIASGIDCLQLIEVQAGMDVLRLCETYGDQIALCGGMDSRNLLANNCAAIGVELHEKVPTLREKSYILHSDESISAATDYDTYRFFVEEGLSLG